MRQNYLPCEDGGNIVQKIDVFGRKRPSVFAIWPWRVIDKSGTTYHPLWFRTYEDLISFYSKRLPKMNLSTIRVVKTDSDGEEVERFGFEEEINEKS